MGFCFFIFPGEVHVSAESRGKLRHEPVFNLEEYKEAVLQDNYSSEI